MYDENSMKSHIFWLKFRRVFLLIFFTIIGTSLGVVISDYIVNILLFPSFLRIIIVVVSSVLFLAFALLITANTGKEVQDGYWKIAVYKKLVIISKKLDNLDSEENQKSIKKESATTLAPKEIKEHKNNTSEKSEAITTSDDSNSTCSSNNIIKESVETQNISNNNTDENNHSLEQDLNDLKETLIQN